VTHVLAPSSIINFLEIPEKPISFLFFQLQTSASNRGNRKTFPTCVCYFDGYEGIQLKLLNFEQEPAKSAGSIHKCLKDSIQHFGFHCDNLSSFSADNVNANFGKKKSGYQHLLNDNDTVVTANCSDHIILNCCEYDTKVSGIDNETVILETYTHFSFFFNLVTVSIVNC
jgi:hypothetical protein